MPTALSLLLLGLMLINMSNRLRTKNRITPATKNKLLIIHAFFLVNTLTSTIFSSVGVERSIQTTLAEIIGLLFSLVLSWWLSRFNLYVTYFFKGFRIAGLIFAIYAVYQLIALSTELPFSYLPMNNASFSLLDVEAAAYHVRALGLTPEPSILASLLIIPIGMVTVDIVLWPSFKQYIYIIVLLLGFLSTSSQSIIILPIYILLIVQLTRSCISHPRNFQTIDLIGLLILALGGILLVLSNPSILISLARLTTENTNQVQSANARFNDFLVALEMFYQNPLFGAGLGSYTDLALQVKDSLGLEGEAGASSSFFRMIAEQGLFGLIFCAISFKILFPPRLPRLAKKEFSALIGYHLCTIVGILLSIIFFVGYRNLYHLWLLIPLGLSLSARIIEAKKESEYES
ncbi:O-antigen ligase family protein [Calothrix sp. FACHB-1219]|uniref:O-antigen ligase family protein n=1 Tax=unclassified Calothrix TaxID=2619626 RepID=UPI0016868636|nr:O-antigen ligase family protein [Calothrix sp. FACHB-168]MBD2201304.1 O-antigen ligase family protein [Calothrix sp. FACHB-168]MBD2215738.1 O-antigen ligase family protein [Calothrix sp. FACHB-1219]